MRHSNGKRSRGRSGRRPAPQQNINRAYDSNGPAGKLRGTAAQLVEKYVSLARDARVGRDRVLVENFFQHAEHYQRIVNEIMIAQGIEPEAIDDDEQGGYDEPSDGNVNPAYEAGNGNGQGGYNGGPRNGGQQGYNQQRPGNGGQQQPVAPQPQPQPLVAGAEDQPEISPDVAVDVPPVSLTPPNMPSAPRAIRGRRRRPQAAAEDAPQAEPAAATEEPSGDE